MKPADPIRQRVASGEKQHGRLDSARTEGLAYVAAVGVRKPDVENEDVGRVAGECAYRLGTCRRDRDREAFPRKRVPHDTAQVVIVLTDPRADRYHDGKRTAQP